MNCASYNYFPGVLSLLSSSLLFLSLENNNRTGSRIFFGSGSGSNSLAHLPSPAEGALRPFLRGAAI